MRILVAVLVGLNLAVLMWGTWHTDGTGVESTAAARNPPAGQPDDTACVVSPVQVSDRVLVGPFRTLRAARAAIENIHAATGYDAALSSNETANMLVVRVSDPDSATPLVRELRDAGLSARPAGSNPPRDCPPGSG